jgi:hypothetical protein
MLISPDRRFVVSHLGWVDKASLWVYDVEKDAVNLVPTGNAKYLSLHPCKDENKFLVFHHFDGKLIRLTIHTFDNPASPLCTVEHSAEKSQFVGDLGALQTAPRFFVGFYNPGHDADYYLISLDLAQSKVQTERFDWYNEAYDKDYQSIIGVIELSSGELIVSIQRDSHPIVYDPTTKTVLRKLSLAGRYGNPKLRFAKGGRELWADDYDTLLKLDGVTLERKKSRRLQGALTGTAEFIGDWSFNEDESLCLVSRPFSGDAVAISTENLKTRYVAKMGRQPLQAVVVNDGDVIGRDWKTGDLLKGSLRQTWFG